MTASTTDKSWVIVVGAVLIGLIVDGMDLQLLALALPSIMKELHLSNVSGGAIATVTFAGMGIGGILAGWISDRIGRVRVVFWAIVLFSIGTGLISLCQTFWQIAAVRFFSGFGLAALYSVGLTLAAEFVPEKRRGMILGIMQAGWSLGYVFAGLISSYVLPAIGWRPLFLSALVPGVICLVMLRGISDPPSWFASREAARKAGKRENEFAKLWADKPVRKIFIAWSLTAIALQFGYYGVNTWLPSYMVKELGVNLKNMGWYVASTYAATVVGKIVAGSLTDYFGRRSIWFASALCTAVAIPVIIHYANAGNVAVLMLLFGFLFGAPYGINSTYLAESFPTSVRGTAVATSYNIGRIGSMSSPILIGYVSTNYSIAFGLALLGVAYAVTAIIPGLFIRDKMYDPNSLDDSCTLPVPSVPETSAVREAA
jgi:MFS transporter, AAHS family, cis,cis-muconate transporter